jgi:hypothetical protein
MPTVSIDKAGTDTAKKRAAPIHPLLLKSSKDEDKHLTCVAREAVLVTRF